MKIIRWILLLKEERSWSPKGINLQNYEDGLLYHSQGYLDVEVDDRLIKTEESGYLVVNLFHQWYVCSQ